MNLLKDLKKLRESKTETYKIDGKKYTEEQLNSMEVIKCKELNLEGRELKTLPSWVAKCIVSGRFTCSSNNLTSLAGAPKSVSENFICSSNKLTSLEGAPESVGGDFYCYGNNLTNLVGSPKSVGGNFECDHNKLTSLQGAPKSVGGNFFCYDNKKQFTEEEVKAVSKVKGKIGV